MPIETQKQETTEIQEHSYKTAFQTAMQKKMKNSSEKLKIQNASAEHQNDI